jgi:hypothetical protein
MYVYVCSTQDAEAAALAEALAHPHVGVRDDRARGPRVASQDAVAGRNRKHSGTPMARPHVEVRDESQGTTRGPRRTPRVAGRGGGGAEAVTRPHVGVRDESQVGN